MGENHHLRGIRQVQRCKSLGEKGLGSSLPYVDEAKCSPGLLEICLGEQSC
jgi:hypothetical protein